MALLMVEGFDHYEVSDSGNERQQTWKGWSGTAFSGVPGRFTYGAQSQGMVVIFANPVRKPIPAPPVFDLVLGFAFWVEVLENSPIMVLYDQTDSNQITVSVTSGGNLTINDGFATTAGTLVIQPHTWYYVELKLDTGTAELHVNGSGTDPGAVVDIAAFAGNFSHPWYLMEFQCDYGQNLGVDDFYLCDLTGPTNNDFLGDVVVETVYPTSDGTYRDWTPDEGTAHYPRVAELHVDLFESYVGTTTAGAADSYGLGDPLQSTAPVLGVQLNLGITKTDSGTRVIEPLVRQGGTDYFGPTKYVAGDWQFVSWLLDQDPTGSDWTADNVNADEYGVKVTT